MPIVVATDFKQRKRVLLLSVIVIRRKKAVFGLFLPPSGAVRLLLGWGDQQLLAAALA